MSVVEILANLLGLLAIVTVTLAGIAGTGVLAARRLKNLPASETITNPTSKGRTNHERTQ